MKRILLFHLLSIVHTVSIAGLAWHPFHEDLFVSGSFDGTIMHWIVGYCSGIILIVNLHCLISILNCLHGTHSFFILIFEA